MSEQKKEFKWYRKIESKEAALKKIKETSWVYFFLVGVYVVLGVVANDISFWFQGFIYLILTILMRLLKSRFLAILLLALLIFEFIFLIKNANNPWVLFNLVIIYSGTIAVQSTFKYQELKNKK